MEPTAPESVTLRDGSRVRIRQLRGSDDNVLLRGFEHLGSESRYRRFLSPMPTLSGQRIHELTQAGRRDHEALVALDPATGDAVGLGEYVRSTARPNVAEVALAVTDEWQERGVGTLLLTSLCARAKENDITSFTALMLAGNEQMMDLLRHIGPVRVVDREAGTVEVEVPIGAALSAGSRGE